MLKSLPNIFFLIIRAAIRFSLSSVGASLHKSWATTKEVTFRDRKNPSQVWSIAFERLQPRVFLHEHRYFWLAAYLCYTATYGRATTSQLERRRCLENGRFMTHTADCESRGAASLCARAFAVVAVLGQLNPSDPVTA